MPMAELGFIASQMSITWTAEGSIWWGQFDGLGWDNGWPEDGFGCNVHGNQNARRYIDNVLRPHVIPFLHNQSPSVTFQHDNARPHTTLITAVSGTK